MVADRQIDEEIIVSDQMLKRQDAQLEMKKKVASRFVYISRTGTR